MKGASPPLEQVDVVRGEGGATGATEGRVQPCSHVHVVQRTRGRPDDVLAGLVCDHGHRVRMQGAGVLAEDAVPVDDGVVRLEGAVEHHGGVIEQGGQLDDEHGIEPCATIHEMEGRHERLAEAVQQPFHPERALEELVEGGVGRVGGVVPCLDLELLGGSLGDGNIERVTPGLSVHGTLPF